jgi:glutamine amidotransferase
MIAVVNYGAGNLGSVANAINKLGYQFRITDKPQELLEAKAVVFPGVGVAGNCMEMLLKTGMAEAILNLIESKRPILAICVGLQVLLSGTEEGGWYQCLNVIPGKVKRFPGGLKIPHIGWNQVEQKMTHPIFEGIPDKSNFYFVHSYFAEPDDNSAVAGTTEYGLTFCSVIIRHNLVATQFHPEKSGTTGLRMYDNFFKMALNQGKW